MRARYSAAGVTSKRQKEAIEELVAEELKKQSEGSARRLLKLMCVSLNKQFGFGQQRLLRLAQEINELSASHAQDEVFWHHVDKTLNQIGMEFLPEDYEEFDR